MTTIDLSTLTFTDQADIVPAPGTTAEIVNTATANTLGGNDQVTGTSTNDAGIINYGTINTGDGSDKITGISNYTGIDNYGTINTGDGNDKIIGTETTGAWGFGIYNDGNINTGADNDSITGYGNGTYLPSYGIYNNSEIDTGAGNDIIDGSNVNPNYGPGYGGSGIHNFGGTINTGAANDIITGTGGGAYYESYGIYNEGTIDTGDGYDQITGTGDSGTGIYNYSGVIYTGTGDDIIKGTSNSDTGIYNKGNSNALQTPTIDTGDGNDSITGMGYYIGIHSAYGNYFSVIDTGSGNDRITGIATNGSGIYNSGGVIDTGTGNDIITGTATSGVGIYNDFYGINTGDGNDSITGTGSVGIECSGPIDTGAGNDRITGTATSGSGINNYYTIDTGDGNDIIDVLTGGFGGGGFTNLGSGTDVIKGFGTGSFDGGTDMNLLDKDTLRFGSGTYTVSATANSDGFYTISRGTTKMFVENFELIGSASNSAITFGFSNVIGTTFTL